MSRRRARELALQALYQIDVGRSDPETAFFQAVSREREEDEPADRLSEKDAAFARELVKGAWEHRAAIDELIGRYARNWAVDRMAAVDRNILRLAIYQVLHREDVPDSVAADEAVELAKAYSTAESGKFINGVLGSVIRSREAQGTAAQEPTVPQS